MEGCTFNVSQYEKELSWIMNYNNDFNFNKLETLGYDVKSKPTTQVGNKLYICDFISYNV